MPEERPPVPAVPSVVLALGGSLGERLAWLERRFRSEIGSLYPASLLRFRLVARADQVSPEALHALCDPLLTHPLWLRLQERGLAPGGERGPQLNIYAILSQSDPRGLRLLLGLHGHLQALYRGRLVPRLYLFYVGASLEALPALPEAGPPLLCFVLGPVKQLGYGTGGRQEPFETVRLALNALLASNAGREIEALLGGGAGSGLACLALGASAIAVARPQMEAWLRSTLLVRLARALLEEAGPGQERQAARAQVAAVFGLAAGDEGDGKPDELWQKRLGRRIAALFPRWANQALQAWGAEVLETRRGQWRVKATAEGDLYRHLEQMLSELAELQQDAQAALVQDVVRLVGSLRRAFQEEEQALLGRWLELVSRSLASGPGALVRVGEIVTAAEGGLARARDALRAQRLSPLWLRTERDVLALAEILAAQMIPVQSATGRGRAAFVAPRRMALRLLPFVLLLGAAGADLWPGWVGVAGGLGGGLLFAALAAGLQYRRLWRETRLGIRELCRLYEDTIGGLMLAQARDVVGRLQEAVAVTAAQLRAVADELSALGQEASLALGELARFPRENTYLERQLSDPAHCARIADEVPPAALLGEAVGDILAAAVRGELPPSALNPALVEAAGQLVARHGSTRIETRVEELVVAGVERPFSPEETMESLHQRALPLWPEGPGGGRELALAVLSPEAAMAFRGWLEAHAGSVRTLATLQRDRISYLRCRRVKCTG